MNHLAGKDNGVYYFLGNITSHISHALPLYREIGGTFVVTSGLAEKVLSTYGVPVLRIDNINLMLEKEISRVRTLLKLPTNALLLGRPVQKTFRYLEEHARVVIFYELFEFTDATKLTKPKTIFLSHGNMLKDYFGMYPRRIKIAEQYDYIAGLGPLVKQGFIKRHGMKPDLFVDLGVARTDELYIAKRDATLRHKIAEELGFNPKKKIVSYFTTYWGASSIYNTAKEILKYVNEDYVVLFQLHPQVPRKIRREYEKLVACKKNLYWVDNNTYPTLTLPVALSVSDVILGDVSSVMLEAVLVDKPLIFVYDTGEHRQSEDDYRIIRQIVDFSEYIDMGNVSNTNEIIAKSISNGIDTPLWERTKPALFYHPNGDSARSIAEFIKSL